MKKTLLIIENDFELKYDRHHYVWDFKEKYDGEVIIMTGFSNKSEEEIKKNLIKATDIAVQTCFVNGSDNQFYEMVTMLKNMPKPLNIYIALLADDLEKYIIDHLSPKELYALKHHTIYKLIEKDLEACVEKLDFTYITDKYEKGLTKNRVHKLYIENYKATAPQRTTGRKILVLACNANGQQFKNLPIGEVVDELDCADLEERKSGPVRGVWIMGNGEPIKLVNDCGLIEYKIAEKMSIEELLVEIEKSTDVKLSDIKPVVMEGIIAVIESDHEEDDNMSKANFICEGLEIPKRGNRQRIYTLLNDNL